MTELGFEIGDIVKRTSFLGGCSKILMDTPVVVLGYDNICLVVGDIVTGKRLGSIFPSRFELVKPKGIEYNEDEWV